MTMRHRIARAGFRRSTLLRLLVPLGHHRLRALAVAADRGSLGRAVLGPAVRWLARGTLHVSTGAAGGLRLWNPWLGHAHLGSIAVGDLEVPVQEAMRRHLGPGGVFYDVGANIGFFALLATRFVGDTGRVIAFEPAPDNAAAILANAALNGVERIAVVERAVGARSGTARLQVVDDQSWSRLEDCGSHLATQLVIEVGVVAIDALVASGELPAPTVVKLDVEGAETAALEGMRAVLREHRPAVICELHDTHREFAALMEEAGYRVINLEGPEPIEEAGPWAHALALPKCAS